MLLLWLLAVVACAWFRPTTAFVVVLRVVRVDFVPSPFSGPRMIQGGGQSAQPSPFDNCHSRLHAAPSVFSEMDNATDNGARTEDVGVLPNDETVTAQQALGLTGEQKQQQKQQGRDKEDEEEEDDLHWFRFGGVSRLYAKNKLSQDVVLERLRASTVAVVGLGGVGSWTAEALFRSGIGHLVLIDLDDICISGTDSQVHTLFGNVGDLKIDAMRQRLRNIYPHGRITLIQDFVLLDNVQEIVGNQLKKELNVTAVIDTIDGDEEKAALLAACVDHNLPVVTCGSPAGRTDPTQLACDDLRLVEGDSPLEGCRQLLVDKFGFSSKEASSAPWNIPSVYSREPFFESLPSNSNDATSFRSDSTMGTASFVTGSFGFVAASRVVTMIVSQEFRLPTRGGERSD